MAKAVCHVTSHRECWGTYGCQHLCSMVAVPTCLPLDLFEDCQYSIACTPIFVPVHWHHHNSHCISIHCHVRAGACTAALPVRACGQALHKPQRVRGRSRGRAGRGEAAAALDPRGEAHFQREVPAAPQGESRKDNLLPALARFPSTPHCGFNLQCQSICCFV